MLRNAHRSQSSVRKPHILYVDDDSSNLAVMEMRLGSHYEVLTATSDREACALLKAEGARLSLVLMDIQLIGSQLDGVQLTHLIRGTLDPMHKPLFAFDVPVRCELPVLFVTAYGEQYDSNALFAAGASVIIAKPVDFVKLSRAMTRHHLRSLLE